jgi:TonB family protein
VRRTLRSLALGLALVASVATAQDLVPPVLKERVVAPYPPRAAAAGLEGSVVLELQVDALGKVADAKIMAPAGHGFDEAALEAVRQFRFEPGRVAGKPVPVTVTYRYGFVLSHKPAERPKEASSLPIRLRGVVTERGTRAPLEGVAVIVTDTRGEPLGRGDSGPGGAFAVPLPDTLEGPISVVIAAPDHKTLKLKERLAPREVLAVRYAIARTSYALYETTVRAQPVREEIGRVSLDGDEVRRIPGTKGDALAAVLNLPSVARSPFDLGQLIIRGSQPGQSGAFLLGMDLPQAFHFAIGNSTFNSYLLERFDLIPSNFSVRYGRLVGGLVDIVPREGKRDRVHGDIKVDLFDAHLIVEGPLKKGSFALSVRRSYADAILAVALPDSALTVAPRYYDYQAMLDYPVAGGKLKLTVFGSDDELALVNDTAPDLDPSLVGQFRTKFWFHNLIANYKKAWRRVELETTLSFGGRHSDAALGAAARFDLDVIRTDLRAELRYRVSSRFRLTAGLDLQTDYFWVKVLAPSPTTEEGTQGPLALEEKRNLVSQGFEVYPALYVQGELRLGDRLVLVPGVRVDWFAGKRGTYAQPRLMARLRVGRETWLKAGAGLYFQPPQAPYDDKVLGNPRVRPEQAVHVTAGIETRPIPRWPAFRIEANLFYKDLRYLAVNSDQFVLRDGRRVPEIYTDEGYGRVYGGDLLIKHDSPRYAYGWVAYTLLKSERQDHPGQAFRPFQYDQTHVFTLVAGYHLPWDVDIGIRLRYATGNPETPLFASGMTIYDADRDTYFPRPAAAFSSRLPDFFQLDARIDKRFVFKTWIFAVYIDVTNVTNRSNVEGYAYSYDYAGRRAAVTGLPILPSLGLRASF